MKNGVQAGNGLVTITYEAPITVSGPPPVQCPAGQVSNVLSATTNAGPISGLFCVNPSTGIGTYTQGSVSGLGIVHQPIGITQISAFGNNLILGGQRSGSVNQFSETAPVFAIGTFSLS
jgi:hypothetical protein